MRPLSYLLAVDWETIVPIVFMVLYGVAQLVAGVAQQKRKPPKPPVARPPVELPRAGVAPAPQQDQLRREVDEFLRKARGEAPRPQPAPVPRKPAQTQQPRRPAASTGQPPQRPRTPVAQPPRRAQEGEPRKARESVADHVRTHIGGDVRQLEQHAAALASHASHLAADVEQADERMEEHLREKFSHQLGTLGESIETSTQRAVRTQMAEELVVMLSHPAGVRQMILAGEILRRPEERWRRGG
ncbi:MAG: hypothetical protein KF847_15175 [Pirellulales bacterium]|nr:hypothetical protein [Pirellulales bacterium]